MPIIRSKFSGSNRIPPNPVPFEIPVLYAEPIPFAASGQRLLALVYDTDNWQTHFTRHGFNTIGDQLAAGYPYYAQPGPLTGSYIEYFDFGVVLTNTIVSVNLSRADVVGDVDVSVSLATHDGVSWSASTIGSTKYAAAVKTVQVILYFSGTNNRDLTVFSRLTVSASVKEQVDSGSFLANSAHASPGTSVSFNKAFKDINSLTATVESANEPYEVVISWVDAPSPTVFYVMVFDTAGNRVTKQVSWKARGVT